MGIAHLCVSGACFVFVIGHTIVSCGLNESDELPLYDTAFNLIGRKALRLETRPHVSEGVADS